MSERGGLLGGIFGNGGLLGGDGEILFFIILFLLLFFCGFGTGYRNEVD